MATGLRLAVDEYPVDFPLAGTSRVEVAGCGIHVAHVPGHSDDSLIFFDPAARRVFSGDTLMDGTHGRTDFPGGSYDQLIQGIRSKILPLGDDVTLCPGHGECSTIGAQRTWI
jgi:glyoxylase-like metal-dependent hydrolase (beta-lactamase superfamily II)